MNALLYVYRYMCGTFSPWNTAIKIWPRAHRFMTPICQILGSGIRVQPVGRRSTFHLFPTLLLLFFFCQCRFLLQNPLSTVT